ncbi:MAG: hypothetical protein ACQEP2_02900 [Actinomycetota bacterium]
MAKFVKYMVIVIVFVVIGALVSCNIFGSRDTETAEEIIETVQEEQNETIVETEPEKTEAEEAEITEEELEDVLFDVLLNFLEAAKNDREYDYFSRQTRQLVGSEEEYVSGAKSDIYFIIKESTADITDVRPEEVTVHKDRAILTVLMDRTVEGMEYEGEEVRYKFVNEAGQWKFDGYHPLGIQISPIQPAEQEVSLSSEGLVIEFNVRSFFPIEEVWVTVNQDLIDQNQYSRQEYELYFSYVLEPSDLGKGINIVTAGATNISGDQAEYSWQANYQE